MDDINLRLEFHRAIDAVAPPAPWLADHVRQDMRRRQATRPRLSRSRVGLIWTPTMSVLLAVVLVVLLAAAAVGVALALHQFVRRTIPVIPHSGPVSRGCSQAGIYMVDANVGWQGTSRTTDGGKTWQDVSPPGQSGQVKGGNTVCATDGTHAWVTYGTGSVTYQPDHVVVMSTRDGGQSWQQGGVIAVPFATDWRLNFSVELSFFDDQDGWLLMEYSSTPMLRLLYATSDGGAHWAVVSRVAGLGLGNIGLGCSENGMMFVSLQRGWLTWNCSIGYGDQPPQSGPVIAGTNDGGLSWAPVSLDVYDPT